MKLLTYGFLLVLAMSTVEKCDKEIEGPSAKLNEAFALELDKTILIKEEKIGITFSGKKESRCPVNVNCMRAGEVIASFQVTDANGQTKEVSLELKDNCSEKGTAECGVSTTAMGYKINLMRVDPYPGSGTTPVTAKLKVMKN